MTFLPVWAWEAGGWGVALCLVLLFLFARNRGIIVTRDEIERSDKNTERTLKLYEKQIELGAATNATKDATIARQAEQIERLLTHSAVSADALTKIIEEAKRRGLAS